MAGLISQRRFPHGRAVALFAAAESDDGVLFSDTFTRADSATTLGSDWTAITGTWGVSGGNAYNPSGTTNACAVVDSGAADALVQVTLSDTTASVKTIGLYVRVTDADNWIRFVFSAGALFLQKKVAGAATATVKTVTQAVAVGDVLGLRLSGASITGLLNGADVLGGAQTVSEFTTIANHGIGAATGTSTGRWRSFKVIAL